MKKVTLLLMLLMGNSLFISCTSDSIAEMEAEMDFNATDGEDGEDPSEEEPPEYDGDDE